MLEVLLRGISVNRRHHKNTIVTEFPDLSTY